MSEYKLNHIAIIPDGNRRWAKEKGQLALEGHKYAVEHTMPALYDELLKLQIPYCTFWALSPENFLKRSKLEIDNLLWLMGYFLDARLNDMHSKNIKVLAIGNIEKLPIKTKDLIHTAVEKTKENTGMTFIFAINYGGRDELLRAINTLLSQKKDVVTASEVRAALDTHRVPDPDLIIRTGGEKRTSGFLLWQSEYTEYIFDDILFPDFTPEMLNQCIAEFHHRKRRFGC